MLDPITERKLLLTRRHLFGLGATGIGAAALGSLLSQDLRAEGGLTGLPHFAPKAKRVIYLFQHGAPSQLDLFDYKPALQKQRGKGSSRVGSNGPAPHWDDGVSDQLSDRPVHLSVLAARAKRDMVE